MSGEGGGELAAVVDGLDPELGGGAVLGVVAGDDGVLGGARVEGKDLLADPVAEELGVTDGRVERLKLALKRMASCHT